MKAHHLLAVGGILLLMAGLAMAVAAQDAAPGEGVAGQMLQDYYDAWITSPHADAEAEAFVHWNEDEEQVVPTSCARCHSTPGYIDYLGDDGSEFRVVDEPAPLGTVVSCDACHTPTAARLQTVMFPSGIEAGGLEDSARCAVCHQGRASHDQVEAAIETAGLLDDPDATSADLRFVNIHYYAAAATLLGSEVKGGYEYDGNVYTRRFDHVEAYDTCAECHNSHTTELRVDDCASCHEDVDDQEDLVDIRMPGSNVDYDGDGDMEEGIQGEIETLQEILYASLQGYAAEVAGTPLVYDEHSHPYFFIDTNANGEADEDEIASANAYNAFSGRLLRAAYNYQVTLKDPGGYAHNAKYHIELLYDSIASLNAELAEPIQLAQILRRDSAGHFDVTAEAFRHWDEDGVVDAGCVKCHTEEGLPFFLEHGTTIAIEPSNSLGCITCHSDAAEGDVYEVEEIVFPSGAVLDFGGNAEANICLNCHQGRESTVSVDRAIAAAGVGDDEVSPALRFRNPHYFAAGATLFGDEAMGAYQFADRDYVGQFEHEFPVETCIDCHQEHTLEIRADVCSDCHDNVEGPEDVLLIREHGDDDPVDFDGDGDAEEPIRDEIATLHNDLLVQIQNYAANVVDSPVVYSAAAYPYWYADTDADGEADDDEINGENQFAAWTPALLRAAYNYQYVSKDPGAFAHNADYILQVLYDSLEAMGGEDAVAMYTRPDA